MLIDTSMKVLVVDDQRTMQRIIRNLLAQIDLTRIETAIDGTEALAKLHGGGFGLVISDWNMLPMTGLDLLMAVRGDPQLHRLPFIMVTAEGKVENVIAAKQAGVSSYIVKPFSAETLRDKIERLMAHA